MRAWSRHAYGLPLAVSLVLHAGLLGGLLSFSTPSAATPAEVLDTRAVGPTRLVLLADEADANQPPAPTKAAAPQGPGPDNAVYVVNPLPVRKENPAEVVAPQVVVPGPGASVGGPAVPTKSGTGGSGKAGGAGSGSVFAAAPAARSVVYVLDRSGSMGQQNAYRRACAEILANVGALPPATTFQVVPYNSRAQPLCVNASLGLLPINPDTVQQTETLLSELPPTGWTDHLCGLRCALLLGPDVLYLVTDADDLRAEDVRTITSLNHGRTVIHTVEMHSRYAAQPTGALARLAGGNRGTYRRVLLED